MSDVFIFGAGASMEYRPSHASLFCDSNFFHVIEQMWDRWCRPLDLGPLGQHEGGQAHYDGCQWDWPKLRDFIEQRCRKSISSIGLEEAFGKVDGEPWESLFCRGLELALFWCIGGTERSRLAAHVDFLERALRPGATLITFNYDPLLEYALRHVSGISWNPSNGYGLCFDGEFSDGQITDIPYAPDSNVELLKLHGSINWLVFADKWPNRPRFLLRLRKGSFHGPGALLQVEKATGRVLRPLFVPPKPAKDYEVFGLTSLWEKAERALQGATSLTVIGYRFPKTDVGARDLIRKAEHLAASDRVTYVTLDDMEGKATFREHFPKASVCPDGFAAYVKQRAQDRQE